MFVDNYSPRTILLPYHGTESSKTYAIGEGVNHELYVRSITFRQGELQVWKSNESNLAQEDLADSIERMYARRMSGLPTPPTLIAQRVYPTDPSTQRTAAMFIANEVASRKAELQKIDAEIKFALEAKAIADEQFKKDAQEFAALSPSKSKKMLANTLDYY